MRRNLAVLVCAAGCLGLVGCHSFDRTDSTAYDNRTLSDTGVTGSSASPYTMERRQYRGPVDTGYTGSSAAPNSYRSNNNTYYRDNDRYDTRPGMVKEKKSGCCAGEK